MQWIRRIAALVLLLGGMSPGLTLGQSAVAQSSIEDAVVLVRAGTTDPANSVKRLYPEGSGFLIDLQGHIITARHVLLKDDTDWERAGRWVSVALRHREATPVSAYIVHCEQGHIDLCLIKVQRAAVSAAGIGSFFVPSCRHLRSEERIKALGYPMGPRNPVLRIGDGTITGELATDLKYPSNIQIIPGMSGGPVLDQDGKVVAVNAAGARDFPTFTFVQPVIYGKGLLDRAGVTCTPAQIPPVAPPCDGVEVAVGSDGERRCIRPGSGQSFRDCPDCPEMVVVPAGSFMMGSSPSEIAALLKESPGHPSVFDIEGPQHQVTIARPFAVGKFEVTFDEWDACVTAGGCQYRPSDQGRGRGKRPAISVSWHDITKQYLPWLSRRTGKTYRLLTEAEWEYVARAGTVGRWSFDVTRRCEYVNHFLCRDGVGDRAAEVGSYKANAFGLHDMHGNVAEWLQDCRNEGYSGAPFDGSAWITGDCGVRAVRGGSWRSHPGGLRSASRYFSPDGRVDTFGFRVARTL